MIMIQEGKTLGSSRGEDSRILIKNINKNKNPQLLNSYNQKRPKRNFNKVQCEDFGFTVTQTNQLLKTKNKEKTGKKWGKMEIR